MLNNMAPDRKDCSALGSARQITFSWVGEGSRAVTDASRSQPFPLQQKTCCLLAALNQAPVSLVQKSWGEKQKCPRVRDFGAR